MSEFTKEFIEIVDWLVEYGIELKDAVKIARLYQNSESYELCDVLDCFLSKDSDKSEDCQDCKEEEKQVQVLADAIKKLREACMGK